MVVVSGKVADVANNVPVALLASVTKSRTFALTGAAGSAGTVKRTSAVTDTAAT